MRRRAFLGASAAATAGLLAGPRVALAAPEGDAGLLASIAAAERGLMAIVETTMIASSHSETGRVLERMLEHDREHVATLDAALEALGAAKPRSEPTKETGLAAIRHHKQAVLLLQRAAAEELIDAKLLQTVAAMAAAEGQHLVALERLIDRD